MAAVALFAAFFPENPAALTEQDRQEAIRSVILLYTAVTFGAALLTWFFVDESEDPVGAPGRPAFPWAQIRSVFQMRVVWLQTAIVVCAYVGYKGIDYYSLFAVDAYGMSEVEGSRISAIAAWVRPFAALGAGLLGDRILSSRATSLAFVLLGVGYLVPVFTNIGPSTISIFFLNVAVTSAAVYGLRAVYFALLEEGAIPTMATGTAVGIVSVLGYSPDIFLNVLAGWLIDTYPGAPGYRYFCFMMMGFAAVGLSASFTFTRVARRSHRRQTAA